MSKPKYQYYILVCTDYGPKFVTSIDWGDKTCQWDKDKTPLAMSKAQCENITLGLCLNWNIAFSVFTDSGIISQPYQYEKGHFEWKWEDKDNQIDQN